MYDGYIHNIVFSDLITNLATLSTRRELRNYWTHSKPLIRKLPKRKIKKLIRVKLEIENNLQWQKLT